MSAVDYHPYQFLAVLLGAVLLFGLVPLALARLWARWFCPRQPGPEKNAAYECGLESAGTPAAQFRSEYYLYGILFLVFDVEALFLLPFAVVFLELPVGVFLAMLVFVLLLVEGWAWAWLKGLLQWR